RLFNGLALAAEGRARGDEVAVLFAGAGTRWPEALSALGHPAKELYELVRPSVVGASCGCAEAFGASASVEACGLPLVTEPDAHWKPELVGPRNYLERGFQTFVY
ncbi:MAG: hypothetical protein KDB53_12840, partial [Planctomycetes bacterium]|nr:hypothetical protein [Planctomycetota bacterium]